MGVRFSELVVDAHDVEKMADFWAAVLGWVRVGDDGGDIEIGDPSGALPTLLFQRVPEGKTVKNRLHLDVSPAGDTDQAAELERLIGLGARHLDIGQGDVTWFVLEDPEGNEFCLLRGPVPR